MSALATILERLATYSTLGMTVTAPGVLMALAFIIGTTPLPADGIRSDTDTRGAATNAVKVLGYWFSPGERIDEQLESLREAREEIGEDLSAATSELLEESRRKGEAAADLANAIAMRDGIQVIYLDQMRQGSVTSEVQSDLAARRAEVETARGRMESVGSSVAAATATKHRLDGSLSSIEKEIRVLRRSRSEQMPILASRLIANLLAILLLGVVVGTMLRPVNKTILEVVTWMYEAVARWTRKEGPREERNGDKVEGAGVRGGPAPPAHVIVLIGQGTITKEDYDFLVGRYYYFAELVIGMCVPVMAFGLALFRWQPSLRWWAMAPVAGFLVLGYWRYRQFHERVDSFIEGARKRAPKDEG